MFYRAPLRLKKDANIVDRLIMFLIHCGWKYEITQHRTIRLASFREQFFK